MNEIERKFLWAEDCIPFQQFKKELGIWNNSEWIPAATQHISQGYLCLDKNKTVRIRLTGGEFGQGYITIKGLSNTSGTTRYEFEQEIPTEDALALLAMCGTDVLEKTRYTQPVWSHDYGKTMMFEIDEFHGANAGLVMVEVELQSEDELIPAEVWVGKEVTGDIRYYNSSLITNPFNTWK